MNIIKHVCINKETFEVYLCTTTIDLAGYLKVSTQYLYKLNINIKDSINVKGFIVLNNIKINKLDRCNNPANIRKH